MTRSLPFIAWGEDKEQAGAFPHLREDAHETLNLDQKFAGVAVVR